MQPYLEEWRVRVSNNTSQYVFKETRVVWWWRAHYDEEGNIIAPHLHRMLNPNSDLEHAPTMLLFCRNHNGQLSADIAYNVQRDSYSMNGPGRFARWHDNGALMVDIQRPGQQQFVQWFHDNGTVRCESILDANGQRIGTRHF